MPEAPTADNIDVRPVASRVAVESLTAKPSAKGREYRDAVRDLGVGTVDAVGGREIPVGMRDNLFIALFGTKDMAKIDPTLKPLATGLDSIMSQLKSNLDPTATTTGELDKAIEAVIQQTPGWNDAFKNMTPTKQAEVIKAIKEMGAASFGRRLMIEKINISEESGNYNAAKRKFEDLQQQLKTRRAEKVKVDAQVATAGGDRAKTTAEQQSVQREVASLQSERTRLLTRKEALLQQMAEREEVYIKKGKTLSTELKKDKTYQDWKKAADQIDDDISNATTGLDKKIADAEGRLKAAETNLQYFTRADQLAAEIEELGTKASQAEADMISARTAFANNINTLMRELNGVLPEAAKEAMNKYKTRLEEANQQKAIDDAEKKAKEAKEAGDMNERAKAEIQKMMEMRYMKKETKGWWKFKKDHYVTDMTALKKDFDDMLDPAIGTRGVMERILNMSGAGGTAPGVGSGLSQEVIDYMVAHPKEAAKLVEDMRVPVFKSIARKAVLRMDFSDTDLSHLADSPDFVEAAQKAVADNAEIKKVMDAVYNADLGGPKTFKEALKRMPAGGLLGILMLLLFGVFGSGLVGAKP